METPLFLWVQRSVHLSTTYPPSHASLNSISTHLSPATNDDADEVGKREECSCIYYDHLHSLLSTNSFEMMISREPRFRLVVVFLPCRFLPYTYYVHTSHQRLTN